ncbi:hypothetical protein GLYMA_01G113901v4 [Glycine max]|nr:hypothetical protein GLYMA_01G113901v4 [Glycine max]KAH1162651.1 hypothetical protein GYH30_001232 [Glycine max]
MAVLLLIATIARRMCRLHSSTCTVVALKLKLK